jgi:hypothetical protein
MNAQQTINRIDAEIDAVRRELMNRLHFHPDCSARQWQAAWDRCPDLAAREAQLFSQRYDARVLRDREINEAWKSEQRKQRAARRRAA